MSDNTRMIEKIVKELGELDVPEEYLNEIPEEEIIHEWEGGVLDET